MIGHPSKVVFGWFWDGNGHKLSILSSHFEVHVAQAGLEPKKIH